MTIQGIIQYKYKARLCGTVKFGNNAQCVFTNRNNILITIFVTMQIPINKTRRQNLDWDFSLAGKARSI